MKLAHTNPSDAAYLGNLSHQLSTMVDVAITVGDTMLPAHSYVLAAASPVLEQQLASQSPDSIEDPDGKAILYALDLTTDGEDCAKAALDYIYSMCPLKGAQPTIEWQEDAEHLANFGHRYKVNFLSTASDGFVHTMLKEEYQIVHHSSYHYNNSSLSKQEVMDCLPDVMRWAMLAASRGLPKVLDYCEKWLACNLKQYPESYTHLQMLQNTSMVRILLMIRECVQ